MTRRIGPVELGGPGPRYTVRLRLTAWYGSLFVLSGAVLLAVTYALVVQALAGNPARDTTCRLPPLSGCHTIGVRQAQAIALRAHAALLHELLTRSVVALALLALLSVALGWFIAGRVLRPLRTITAAARQISAARLGERLALGGPHDELRELGDTFDGLLTRLEAAFTAQRQFIANAAHELRTPLARQRVVSQVALADPGATAESLRAAHERVLASGAEQQQLIDALLTLARGQAGPDKHEPFDLADLASKVLADRQSEARRRNLTLHATLSPAPATGGPELAERLTANLIDNALRHNLPGGRVEITTGTINFRAVLSVANSGPSIAPDAVERLFQPFQRLGTNRTNRGEGLGLGLSIVQAIAQTHGASITVSPRGKGGLLINVTFPISPIASAPHDPPTRPITVASTDLTSATPTQPVGPNLGAWSDKARPERA
jgi:signal transduction histidine kinase